LIFCSVFNRALALTLSRRVERKDEKILTAPLTFVLSRKGREKSKKEFNRIPLTLTLSRGMERELVRGEKG
jgi:hypothetical protein